MENNNMNLEEFFNNLFPSEEEKAEVSQYQFDSEGEVDDAIESVMEFEVDEKRLQSIFEEKTDRLKYELDYKLLQIGKKKDWILFNLKNSVMASKDKKDLKTMYKKTYLSGEVVITKSKTNLLKPELTEEIILKDFADYAKTKTVTTLDWKGLKAALKIIDGKVILASTGKDLSTTILTEVIAEVVTIKQ